MAYRVTRSMDKGIGTDLDGNEIRTGWKDGSGTMTGVGCLADVETGMPRYLSDADRREVMRASYGSRWDQEIDDSERRAFVRVITGNGAPTDGDYRLYEGCYTRGMIFDRHEFFERDKMEEQERLRAMPVREKAAERPDANVWVEQNVVTLLAGILRTSQSKDMPYPEADELTGHVAKYLESL